MVGAKLPVDVVGAARFCAPASLPLNFSEESNFLRGHRPNRSRSILNLDHDSESVPRFPLKLAKLQLNCVASFAIQRERSNFQKRVDAFERLPMWQVSGDGQMLTYPSEIES